MLNKDCPTWCLWWRARCDSTTRAARTVQKLEMHDLQVHSSEKVPLSLPMTYIALPNGPAARRMLQARTSGLQPQHQTQAQTHCRTAVARRTRQMTLQHSARSWRAVKQPLKKRLMRAHVRLKGCRLAGPLTRMRKCTRHTLR